MLQHDFARLWSDGINRRQNSRPAAHRANFRRFGCEWPRALPILRPILILIVYDGAHLLVPGAMPQIHRVDQGVQNEPQMVWRDVTGQRRRRSSRCPLADLASRRADVGIDVKTDENVIAGAFRFSNSHHEMQVRPRCPHAPNLTQNLSAFNYLPHLDVNPIQVSIIGVPTLRRAYATSRSARAVAARAAAGTAYRPAGGTGGRTARRDTAGRLA